MSALLDRPLRAAILSAADNRLVRRVVTRYGMRLGARRFVAGENMAQFLPIAQEANAQGFSVAATLLGESIRDPDEARSITDEYCALLRAFAAGNYDANVAFKLTHVGLDVDRELAFQNATRIAETAREHGNTMRMDMEQSRYVDATLAIYRRLRERFDNVGFVLQSYLYRSEADLETVLSLGPNLRIVKGAYLEPPSLAYPQKRDVDESYRKLAQTALSHGGYTAIATHDPKLVQWTVQFADEQKVPNRGRFEFQMLYGIATPLARDLVQRGYRVRLSIPYGDFWFPYLMRRLAERPANVGFFLRNVFR